MRGALFISLGLAGLSTLLILLVLIAGTNKHVLVDWFFLKANTGALSVSSKLSNSTYLSDLSKVSGTDLVGSNANSSSLGIGNWTTISLFTSCTDTNSSVTCSTPHFGFSFSPSTGLKLDSTGLQGSHGLVSIPSYGHLSQFLGIAYILALLLTVLTKGMNILSCCVPRAVIASAFTSILATIFLLAASGAALGVFINLKGKWNAALLSAGIKTALGSKLFIVSWIATVLMLLNSILLCVSYRHQSKQGRQRGMARGVGVIDHSGMDKSGVGTETFAAPKRTRTLQLLKKVGTWKRQKYTQIEKQPAVRGIPNDEDILNRRGFGGGEDEDEDEIELARHSTRGIPLQPFGNTQTKDISAAYEPYRQAGGE
ncbi:hypothetical protein D0Z07_1553 [Hyphodiscus hymeniophilus]|uniref:Uncharacterized protein n=1 Tax=Hyphodiscus hymeniophilus TaxID=353542 RepID=A0A9P7AZ89_9HELO|nr:hypothetical protein D0Z07_1553 [Hyphodiscus hymeniophilus]